MKKKASIIIGYTPYHAIIAKELLREIPGDAYCFFTKAWPNGNYTPLGDKKFSTMSTSRKTLSLYRTIKRIKKLLKCFDEITLYLPHPSHLIGNYLFFHKKTTNIHIYEDGILNYYDTKSRNIHIIQIAASILLNIRYTKYHGLLSGINAKKVQAVHLTRPTQSIHLPDRTEIRKINLGAIENYTPDDILLFLDQNTDKHLTPEQRSTAIATANSIATEHNLRIITKSHHDQAKREPNDDTTIQPDEAAELTIQHVKPKIVVSFFSSALINIKQIEPQIRCISLSSKHITVNINKTPVSLSKIFESAGVECI